jgi:hypothetical protein
MSHPKLTPERLLRAAAVYVRQSTPSQVTHNMESQRRQYGVRRQLDHPAALTRDFCYQREVVAS